MLVERAEGCAPEDVGVEPLLSVLVLEGLLPVERCELQDSADRPARQEAEEVAEIGVGLDVVELAARQQRDEGGVDLGGVVGADEEPILSSDGFAPQRPLGAVVVDGEPTVVQEALERDTLIEGVANGLGGRGLVENLPRLRFAPGEEGVDDGLGLGPPAASRTSGSAAPAERSTRNRPPMYASAWRARSGSVSSAFHQYRRACAQHATSINVPRLYR